MTLRRIWSTHQRLSVQANKNLFLMHILMHKFSLQNRLLILVLILVSLGIVITKDDSLAASQKQPWLVTHLRHGIAAAISTWSSSWWNHPEIETGQSVEWEMIEECVCSFSHVWRVGGESERSVLICTCLRSGRWERAVSVLVWNCLRSRR